jgi:hypothetical protein
MANVRLGRYEAEDYELPKVCMRCGAPATTYRYRNFRWCPGWVLAFILLGVVPYFILSEVLMKRMSVRVPCCDEHKKKPLWPTLVTLGTLLGLILIAVGAILLLNDPGALGITCLIGVPAFIVWMFASVVIHTPAIRPIEITEKSITLRGVSEGFIAALDADRRGDRPEGDEARPRRKRRERDRDDDGGYYDPDGPRRRRRDDDEDDR